MLLASIKRGCGEKVGGIPITKMDGDFFARGNDRNLRGPRRMHFLRGGKREWVRGFYDGR